MALAGEKIRPSGRQALDAAERELRETIAAADAAPFLGHHDLPDGAEDGLQGELERGTLPLSKRLRLLFHLWPALTVTWVSNTVSRRYGTLAQMELYPHLEELFRSRIDAKGRKRIADSFRHACRRLDLPLPENAEPVDTYVVQGGVPVAQIGVLARAFTVAERREGLPDIDDDVAVGVFTQAAVAAVDIGHPRLRRVLEHDAVGWYARLWVTLRERPEELPNESFASQLAEAAQLDSELRGASFRRPHLLWRDNLLGVEVPAGSGLHWTFHFGGAPREIIGRSQPLVLPLPEPWPAALDWSLVKPAGRMREAGSLALPTDPQELLFFAAGNGRLTGRTWFEHPPADRPLRLARGEYEAASIGHFSGPEGLEAASFGRIYSTRFRIADAPVAFARGEHEAIVAPVQRPALELAGTSIRDLHGTPIFADRALRAHVAWPTALEGGQEARDRRYELIVAGGGLAVERLPLVADADGQPTLEIGRHFEGSPPMLRRVVLKLVRAGERRPIARTAAFVWVGLESAGGFSGRPPRNLVPAACAHLAIDERRVALRSDQPYASARLAVDDPEIAGRRHVFEFAYPGLIASLRWFDGEGRQHEEVLERDAIVALKPGDTRLLDVTSPDPRAVLRIGASERVGVFADRARVSLPLAAVSEACQGGADRLAVQGSDGLVIGLARFTVPCEVARWSRSYDPARLELSLLLGFREPLQRLRVRARDLWGGARVEVVLDPDALRRGALPDGMSLRLERDFGDPHHGARLVVELDDWPDGLWLLDLDARLSDGARWQALVNLRGDVFAWLVPHGLDDVLAGDLGERLTLSQRLQIFARCHKELQRCFALPCWQGGVDHVLRIWRRIGGSLEADDRLPECWPALLLLAFVEPPLDASESWLPLISFWEVLPEFMALSAASYAGLTEVPRDDAQVVALLGELAKQGSVGRFLVRWRLDPSFFRCFGNLAEVHASAGASECRRFDFKAYAAGVRADVAGWDGWLPTSAALSPLHFAFATESLIRRYRVIASSAGNGQRVPGAARLAHDAARWLERDGRKHLNASVPDLLIDGAPLDLTLPMQDDVDALLQIAPVALGAIALACRLQARRGGALNEFLAILAGIDRDRSTVLADINFLASMGRDLFAFWMLFWEVLLTTGEPCRI